MNEQLCCRNFSFRRSILFVSNLSVCSLATCVFVQDLVYEHVCYLLFSAPSGPPRTVTVEAIGSESLRVYWKVNKSINKIIDHYIIICISVFFLQGYK